MNTINRYILPEDIARSVIMVAKFDLYTKENPECPASLALANNNVRREVADAVFNIIVEQEKKKLLK